MNKTTSGSNGMTFEPKIKEMISPNSIAKLPFGRRESLIHAMLELLSFIHNPFIVEIGTTRGNTQQSMIEDGWASVLFAHVAVKRRGLFISVDINNNAVKNCKNIINDYINDFWGVDIWKYIEIINIDSISFLNKVKKDGRWKSSRRYIDFLYMDGAYDGKQNLDEINAALPLLCEGALVLFDNTIYVGDITDKMFAGRGEFAIPLLQESGFKIINYVYDGYNSQVLLRRM